MDDSIDTRSTFGRGSTAVGTAVGAVALLLELLLELSGGRLTPFDRIAYPTIATVLALFTFALASRRLGRHAYPLLRHALYATGALLISTKLAYLLYALPVGFDPLVEFNESTPWLPVVFALGFVNFRSRTALRLGMIVSGAMAVIGAPFVISAVGGSLASAEGGLVNTLVQNFLAHALLLYLFYAFALTAEKYITSRAREIELQALVHTDPLTGLFNRRHLEIALRDELHRAARYLRTLSVIIVDIDHFKGINDRFGHQVGDEVLRHVGSILSRDMREEDFAARWGGEEFCLVLPETDLDTAYALAERLRRRFASIDLPADDALTGSFGIAQYNHRETVHGLLERADAALYEAKMAGRNRSKVAA